MKENIYINSLANLYNIIDEKKLRINEPMTKHTTFKIGGCADILVLPDSIEDIVNVIKYANKNNIPVTIIGSGSKILVLDGGIRGIVIKIGSSFNQINIKKNIIEANSGVMLPMLSNKAKSESLSGLEFACGIPGTLGGAIFQNAGAYDGDMQSVISEVTYLDENLNICIKTKDELEFGYRTSYFKKNNDKNFVILSAKLTLKKGDINEIQEKMKQNSISRKEKQPIEYPSAGSVFKRPEGAFVGKLVDDVMLRGFSFGGAKISDKHSGFIVNMGNAKASDVVYLINKIKKEVLLKFNIELEEEIIILGEEEK